MKRRMISVVLSLALCLSLLPVTALTAAAADGVPYQWCDENGRNWETRYCETYTVMESTATAWGTAGEETWYVVNTAVTISERITVSGNVHLILADGGKLTASNGICVNENNSFTIYGQSGGTGSLQAGPSYSGAGIGSNDNNTAGTITINGGNITARAPAYTGDAAGIGGGAYGNAGTIIINGGNLDVNGCNKGIGGGAERSGGTIIINGGIVASNGIGAGAYSSSTNLFINGGIVKSSGSINTTNESSWTGIVYRSSSGKVYGDIEITEDLELSGNLTIQEGSSLTVADGATLTNKGSLTNEGSLTVTDGATLTSSSTLTNNGTLDSENGTIKSSGWRQGAGTLRGEITVENGGWVYSGNTSVILPDGGTVDSGGTVSARQVSVGSVTVKGDPVTVSADGEITIPEGGTVDISGNPVDLPEGTRTIKSDYGNVVLPGGSKVHLGKTTIEVPEEGASMRGWGNTMEVPVGSKITPPSGEPVIVIEEGWYVTVDSDGNVTFGEDYFSEGGKAKIGDTTVEIPRSDPSSWEPGGGNHSLRPREDGTVEVPENSKVIPPNGPEMTLPKGGAVDQDGNITLDSGQSAETGDGTITNNGGNITITDGDGNTTTVTPADGVKVDSDGNVAVPEDATVKTGDGPEMTLPEGGTVGSGGTITAPEIEVGGTTVKSSGNDNVTADKDGITVPEGGIVQTEGGPEMTLPNGGRVDKDGNVAIPNEGTVTPKNGPDITLPNGGAVDTDGNITSESGSAQIGDTKVTLPEGGTLKPDDKGGVEIPNGSKVTPPGGPEIGIADGPAAMDKDGNVTFPEGGSAKVGDTTVTVPKGGTVTPNEDGTLDVPPGSIVKDKDGKEITVPSQGGKLDGAGNYTDNTKPTPIPPSAPSTPSTPSAPSGSGSSAPSTYPPTVSKADNGKVSTSPSNPKRGDTVTVTPTPNEGYEVGGVVVKDSKGSVLEVKDNGDGTFSFTQPTGKVTIEVTFVPQKDEPDSPALAFSDLDPNAWYWESVDYMVRNGLMTGYGKGKFAPNDNLSRAMLAQILYNAEDRPGVGSSGSFTDVLSGAWYADAIEWAAANNIVIGNGNGSYGPEDPIIREQFAVMLYRYAQSKDGRLTDAQVPVLNFADISDVSGWAADAMAWAVSNGIIEGKGDGILDPKGRTTRAEAAAMLMRFLTRQMEE